MLPDGGRGSKEFYEMCIRDSRNVKVINADIMKTDIKKLIRDEFGDKRISVAANLPYYITTPVITRLLEAVSYTHLILTKTRCIFS